MKWYVCIKNWHIRYLFICLVRHVPLQREKMTNIFLQIWNGLCNLVAKMYVYFTINPLPVHKSFSSVTCARVSWQLQEAITYISFHRGPTTAYKSLKSTKCFISLNGAENGVSLLILQWNVGIVIPVYNNLSNIANIIRNPHHSAKQ